MNASRMRARASLDAKALAPAPERAHNPGVKQLQADIELALIHIRQVEQCVAEQSQRIVRLKAVGGSTEIAEDFLKTLQQSLALLKQHLARIIGPVEPDKASH